MTTGGRGELTTLNPEKAAEFPRNDANLTRLVYFTDQMSKVFPRC